MKRFNELTKSQQSQAVEYALTELKECINLGLLSFDKAVSDEVLCGYAEAAAENAYYACETDKIVYDIIEGGSYEN